MSNLNSKKFNELSIPLVINTTNYLTGDHKFVSKGEIIPSVLASASTPPIFPPVKLGKGYFVDGSINNGSMIKLAKEMGAKKVFFINLYRKHAMKVNSSLFSNLSYLFHLMEKNIAYRELEFVDKNVVEIRPRLLSKNSYLDFGLIPDFVMDGYKTAKKLDRDGDLDF
jgi:predicted acylesterase/phospholipase RssA